MLDIPQGSIYMSMYTWGLQSIDYYQLIDQLIKAGKQIRQKDIDNYWNGWYNRRLYHGDCTDAICVIPKTSLSRPYFKSQYKDYPEHPFKDYPEVENRFVPCSSNGTPIIKFSKGCLTQIDAECMIHCETLAENTKGAKHIVIDVDGDHGDIIHEKVIQSFLKYKEITHCLEKPEWDKSISPVSPSFHLTFAVDRIIPTMHFANAHIDIVGNKMNSLRYFKNKIWNSIEPRKMDPLLWIEIRDKIKELEYENQ